MPSIEPRDAFLLILGRYARLVESRVGGMFEHRLCEAFVVVDGSVSDELDLRHARDGFEVWVEDGFLLGAGFVVPVAVALAGWVESLEGVFRGGFCSSNRLGVYKLTFVSAYCCSGVRSVSRNKRAPC